MIRRGLCLLLLGVLCLYGFGPASDLVPGPTSSTFRIVAYNAEWLFDGLHDPHDCPRSGPTAAQEHLEAVADTLRAFEADYISLAEVEDDSMLDRLNELLGGAYYPIFYPGKDSATRQNVAALSAVAPTQSPSRTPERTVYPVPGSLLACGSGSQGVSKNYVVGLDLAGMAVTIVGVHFLAFPKWCEQAVQREAQATIIADTARAALEAGREVIVLGDLNDFDGAALDAAGNKPISRVLAILKNLDPAVEGDELVNVCATLPQEDRYTDWYDRDSDHIDDGTREHSQIDFILVSRGLAERIAFVTIAHTTPAGAVSDHWPIVLDLSIPSEVASATP